MFTAKIKLDFRASLVIRLMNCWKTGGLIDGLFQVARLTTLPNFAKVFTGVGLASR